MCGVVALLCYEPFISEPNKFSPLPKQHSAHWISLTQAAIQACRKTQYTREFGFSCRVLYVSRVLLGWLHALIVAHKAHTKNYAAHARVPPKGACGAVMCSIIIRTRTYTWWCIIRHLKVRDASGDKTLHAMMSSMPLCVDECCRFSKRDDVLRTPPYTAFIMITGRASVLKASRNRVSSLSLIQCAQLYDLHIRAIWCMCYLLFTKPSRTYTEAAWMGCANAFVPGVCVRTEAYVWCVCVRSSDVHVYQPRQSFACVKCVCLYVCSNVGQCTGQVEYQIFIVEEMRHTRHFPPYIYHLFQMNVHESACYVCSGLNGTIFDGGYL